MSLILVVDDEPQILRVLRAALQSSGYQVVTARDGSDGLIVFEKEKPDLVVTDLSMPVMDGLALTKALREVSDVPIIVLSVRSGEAMKVQALDYGADDYLTKPFSTLELLARVRAQLRRLGNFESSMVLETGDFSVDEISRTAAVRGETVHLTPKEFDLLLVFLRKPGRTLTHQVLLRQVWGSASGHQPENLRVLVGALRKKLEPKSDVRYIVSEPWVGYRFYPAGDAA